MTDDDPVLRRVVVDICENCISGKVGQCHVPGCLFIRFNIEDTGPIDDTTVIPVTRAMLFAGMLVGIGGEHDEPPSDLQLERATDLITRASERRFGHPVTRDDLITAVSDILWRYPNDVPSLVDALLTYYRIEGKTLQPQTLEIRE